MKKYELSYSQDVWPCDLEGELKGLCYNGFLIVAIIKQANGDFTVIGQRPAAEDADNG